MYMIKSILLSFFLAWLTPNFSQVTAAPNKEYKKKTRKKKPRKREDMQKDFFSFAISLFIHTNYILRNRERPDEPAEETYLNTGKEVAEKISLLFKTNRLVLTELASAHDLHIINKTEIMPRKVYDFIRRNFSIKNKRLLSTNEILQKIIGGNFKFHFKTIKINGLIHTISTTEMNKWTPIKSFISNFRDTLTSSPQLSNKIGRTLLPMVQNYYKYMDTVLRLRLFKEILTTYKERIHQENSNKKQNQDTLSIEVFQASGPIMIKLLQQIQDEIIGESSVAIVLAGLKNTKKIMNPKLVGLRVKNYIKSRNRTKVGRKNFKFQNNPLGVASIAQTHKFEFKKTPYVVKIQKKFLKEVFQREKKFMLEMISKEKEFDKGMKQLIINTSFGIAEELDFNIERNNLNQGFKAYQDPENRIFVVNEPKSLRPKEINTGKEILFMSLAGGSSLGKVMETGQSDSLLSAYKAMQRLYEKFLNVALIGIDNEDSEKFYFYHGDLHRENIFYDENYDKVYLIDFGNAGIISISTRESLIKILSLSAETNEVSDLELEKVINKLGQELHKLILSKNKKRFAKSKYSPKILDSYFKTCFNPEALPRDNAYEAKLLSDIKLKIDKELSDQKILIQNKSKLANPEKAEIMQDDIDFIKALQTNCLTGAANEVLTTLANPDYRASEKMRIVFEELLKNGIALPTDLIFFNKSKSLLEGILDNIANSLDMQIEFDYVDTDSIYNKIIKKLNNKHSDNKD